jgi:hypothetical protein
MSKNPTNKNDKRKKYGLPSGSLPVRAKSLFNFLPNQPPNTEYTLPLTDENLRLYGTTLEGYNSPHSSLDNDNDDDDAQTVITDYASNPYGLTTPPPPAPNDEMDVDDYEPPATELKTYEGKDMYHIINGELIPVTSASYNREWTVYDIHGNIIPRKEHLPEKRLRENNNIMDYIDKEKEIGGKRRRKPHRKTIRKTKRKKTRRHRRRNTKKYK